MKKHNLTGVLVLVIFAVFMVSVLRVLLSGADIVQNISRRDQQTYLQRTAVQYITTRIRHADQHGCVTVENSGEESTLVLTEEIDGRQFQTRVYCCDGYLREMFCEAGTALPPEFGEEILAMKDFQITCEDALLRGQLMFPDGSQEELFFLLRSEGGVLS